MRIPYEIKQEAIWIVRGYDMRKRNYERMRSDILNHMTAGAGDDTPHGSDVTHPTEDKALELQRLERWPEVKKMRAVEYAERQIGQDILSDEVRDRLRNAILQNTKSGRRFPFERLGISEFSRRDFYRRKDKFLLDVASFLEMV